MALLEVRCDKCGSLFQADPNAAGPVVCSRCQREIPRSDAFPSPRPMPRVNVAGANGGRPKSPPAAMPRPQVAGDQVDPAMAAEGEDLEPSAIQAAFSEAFPWAMSIAFHLAVLLVLTFVTCFAEPMSKTKGSGPDDEETPTEALSPTHRQGNAEMEGSPIVTNNKELEALGKGTDRTDFSGPGGEMPDFGTNGGATESLLADIAIPGSGGSAGGSGDSTGIGDAGLGKMFSTGNGLGKGGNFFGQGYSKRGVTRVLFLVDKSGSMNTLFDYVKIELKRFIGELNPRQEFQVIMFSDGPPDELKIEGVGGLHFASDKNKKAATDWVKKKYAKSEKGETSPVDSFKRAFAIQPNLPQLIYVLTDGGFPDEVLDYLRGVNKDKNGTKVLINTIGFASREGEEVLTKMAKENGGTYKYLDESELKKYGSKSED
jgi:hypothetical protein